MFTGIVEATGIIEIVRTARGGGRRLRVTTSLDLRRVVLGGSIAVDGVCLTVVARRGRAFEADLGPETLARTTLGGRAVGARVNLERPLRLGDLLGGHFVTGHVDGVGTIAARRERREAVELQVRAPRALGALILSKGSVTLDGVSLTVNRVDGAVFSVMLIPHTIAVTSLGERRPRDRVNLEVDLIAKHIARMVKTRAH